MQLHASSAERRDVGFASLLPFLLITFGLAWGLGALFVAFPETIEGILGPFGATNPLFILAVYAPAIAAFVLVLARTGVAGFGRFLSRLLLWRAPPIWYAILILGIPAVYSPGRPGAGRCRRSRSPGPASGRHWRRSPSC